MLEAPDLSPATIEKLRDLSSRDGILGVCVEDQAGRFRYGEPSELLSQCISILRKSEGQDKLRVTIDTTSVSVAQYNGYIVAVRARAPAQISKSLPRFMRNILKTFQPGSVPVSSQQDVADSALVAVLTHD